MSQDTVSLVIESIREVMRQNDIEETSLTAETAILTDTALDSLALAEVLIVLEGKTRKDPFADGFINFRTVGELAKLYEG